MFDAKYYMTMKKRYIPITLCALVALMLVACSDNMGTPDKRLAPVTTFVEPMDAREVVLQPDLAASLYFEWERVDPAEAGILTYHIAFDRGDGDFTSPIHIVKADNNGFANTATISHKDMNKIAGKGGINPSDVGTLKWAVFASKGADMIQSSVQHSLIITRLGGFDEIPLQLYITGAATETGNNIANAYELKKLSDGVFEIYTELTAGQPFHFVSSRSEGGTAYSLTEENIVIDGTSQVEESGVYKFYLDFEIGSFSTKQVTQVALFLNWSQRLIELPYVGNGVWGVTDYEITGLSGNDNSDDRYKFRMKSSEGETEWRAVDNDSKPTGEPEYYHMVERTNVQQWTDGQIWKTPATDGWSGKRYDITFSLNPQGPYTHNLIIK